MKLINRDTDYSFKVLIYIVNRSPDLVSVPELNKELGIPGPFLRKILQILSKEGILNSLKGRNGGFQLALPPEKVTLKLLMQVFQGPVKLNDCLFRKHICQDVTSCPLKKKLDGLEDRMVSELQSITLASLLEDV